jgi:hypothetical protein
MDYQLLLLLLQAMLHLRVETTAWAGNPQPHCQTASYVHLAQHNVKARHQQQCLPELRQQLQLDVTHAAAHTLPASEHMLCRWYCSYCHQTVDTAPAAAAADAAALAAADGGGCVTQLLRCSCKYAAEQQCRLWHKPLGLCLP